MAERLLQATFQAGQVCPFVLRSDGLGHVVLCPQPVEEDGGARGPSRSRRRCLAARQLQAGDQVVSVGDNPVSRAGLQTANSFLSDQTSVRDLMVRRVTERGPSRRQRRSPGSALSVPPDDRRGRSVVQPFKRPAPAPARSGGGDDVISLLEDEEGPADAPVSASDGAAENAAGHVVGGWPAALGVGAGAGAADAGTSCSPGAKDAPAASGRAGAADGLQIGMMVSTPYGPGVVDELSAVRARVRFTWADGHLARACVAPLKDKVALRYAPGGARAMVLTGEDEARLQPGYHLNDTLIDWYLRYLRHERWEREQLRVHTCTSLLLARLEEVRRESQSEPRKRRQRGSSSTSPSGREGAPASERPRSRTEAADDVAHAQVRGWLRRVDLFALSVLLLPVCRHNHWSLAMVLNLPLLDERIAAAAAAAAEEEAEEGHPPAKLRRGGGRRTGGKGEAGGEEEDQDEPMPCIVLLDSMGVHRSQTTAAVIRAYLAREWRSRNPGRHGVDSVWSLGAATLPCVSLEAPRQLNEVDCGVFLLEYAERYVAPLARIEVTRRDVARRLVRVTQQFGAFDQGTVDAKRLLLRQLIARLARGEGTAPPAPAPAPAAAPAPAPAPAPAGGRAGTPAPAGGPAGTGTWSGALSAGQLRAEARSTPQAADAVPAPSSPPPAAPVLGGHGKADCDDSAAVAEGVGAPGAATEHEPSPLCGPRRVTSPSGLGKEAAVSAALEEAKAWQYSLSYPTALPRLTGRAPFVGALGVASLPVTCSGERHAPEPACAPTTAASPGVGPSALSYVGTLPNPLPSAQRQAAASAGVASCPSGPQWGSPPVRSAGQAPPAQQPAPAEPVGPDSENYPACATVAGGALATSGAGRQEEAGSEQVLSPFSLGGDGGIPVIQLAPDLTPSVDDAVAQLECDPLGAADGTMRDFAPVLQALPPGAGLRSRAPSFSGVPLPGPTNVAASLPAVAAPGGVEPQPTPGRTKGCGSRRRLSGSLVAGFMRGLRRPVRTRPAEGGASGSPAAAGRWGAMPSATAGRAAATGADAAAESHAGAHAPLWAAQPDAAPRLRSGYCPHGAPDALSDMYARASVAVPGNSTHPRRWSRRRQRPQWGAAPGVNPHGGGWAGEADEPAAKRKARRPEDLPEQARSEDEDEDAHFMRPEVLSEVEDSSSQWPLAGPAHTQWAQGGHDAAGSLALTHDWPPDGGGPARDSLALHNGAHTAADVYNTLGVHPV